MTLTPDEAIRNLQTLQGFISPERGQWQIDSIQLGIEALKRCRDYKKAHLNLHYTPMPGETE